jgi:hypothetical protein
MTEDPSRKRLGRGLAALIGEIDRPDAPVKAVSADGKVPIELIAPNPRNPRRTFGEADLADLAQSLREHGLVQPVVVRPAPAKPGTTRSSPAKGAGVRHSSQASARYRSSCAMSTTGSRWKSQSSRTCSGRI